MLGRDEGAGDGVRGSARRLSKAGAAGAGDKQEQSRRAAPARKTRDRRQGARAEDGALRQAGAHVTCKCVMFNSCTCVFVQMKKLTLNEIDGEKAPELQRYDVDQLFTNL